MFYMQCMHVCVYVLLCKKEMIDTADYEFAETEIMMKTDLSSALLNILL